MIVTFFFNCFFLEFSKDIIKDITYNIIWLYKVISIYIIMSYYKNFLFFLLLLLFFQLDYSKKIPKVYELTNKNFYLIYNGTWLLEL